MVDVVVMAGVVGLVDEYMGGGFESGDELKAPNSLKITKSTITTTKNNIMKQISFFLLAAR